MSDLFVSNNVELEHVLLLLCALSLLVGGTIQVRQLQLQLGHLICIQAVTGLTANHAQVVNTQICLCPQAVSFGTGEGWWSVARKLTACLGSCLSNVS